MPKSNLSTNCSYADLTSKKDCTISLNCRLPGSFNSFRLFLISRCSLFSIGSVNWKDSVVFSRAKQMPAITWRSPGYSFSWSVNFEWIIFQNSLEIWSDTGFSIRLKLWASRTQSRCLSLCFLSMTISWNFRQISESLGRPSCAKGRDSVRMSDNSKASS